MKKTVRNILIESPSFEGNSIDELGPIKINEGQLRLDRNKS